MIFPFGLTGFGVPPCRKWANNCGVRMAWRASTFRNPIKNDKKGGSWKTTALGVFWEISRFLIQRFHHMYAAAAAVKLDEAVHEREQGPIVAAADAFAGVKL